MRAHHRPYQLSPIRRPYAIVITAHSCATHFILRIQLQHLIPAICIFGLARRNIDNSQVSGYSLVSLCTSTHLNIISLFCPPAKSPSLSYTTRTAGALLFEQCRVLPPLPDRYRHWQFRIADLFFATDDLCPGELNLLTTLAKCSLTQISIRISPFSRAQVICQRVRCQTLNLVFGLTSRDSGPTRVAAPNVAFC